MKASSDVILPPNDSDSDPEVPTKTPLKTRPDQAKPKHNAKAKHSKRNGAADENAIGSRKAPKVDVPTISLPVAQQRIVLPPRLVELMQAAKVPAHMDGTIADDVMEVFSPPRIVPHCQALGLRGDISIDVRSGFDLLKPEKRVELCTLLRSRRPKVLITCPPCTFFSKLMFSNWTRMSETLRQKRMIEGCTHMDFANILHDIQLDHKRDIIHEHPDDAASFIRRPMLNVIGRIGGEAQPVRFDQCMFGLKDMNGTSMRKRTKLVTSMASVIATFGSKFCDGTHSHRMVEGTESGLKLTCLSQTYPPEMCAAIAQAIKAHLAIVA